MGLARTWHRYRISSDMWDVWGDVSQQLDTVRNYFQYARPGSWPDGDMIPLGRIGGVRSPINKSEVYPPVPVRRPPPRCHTLPTLPTLPYVAYVTLPPPSYVTLANPAVCVACVARVSRRAACRLAALPRLPRLRRTSHSARFGAPLIRQSLAWPLIGLASRGC